MQDRRHTGRVLSFSVPVQVKETMIKGIKREELKIVSGGQTGVDRGYKVLADKVWRTTL